MNIPELLSATVEWHRDNYRTDLFHARVGGEAFQLRINDFPDKPFCTVVFGGKEHDLEDTGKNWKIPWWKRGESLPGGSSS